MSRDSKGQVGSGQGWVKHLRTLIQKIENLNSNLELLFGCKPPSSPNELGPLNLMDHPEPSGQILANHRVNLKEKNYYTIANKFG